MEENVRRMPASGTVRRLPMRSRLWVTKTDLARYVRCPYAFWLLDKGAIRFEDTIDEFQLRLLLEGNEFQQMVEESATPVAVEPEGLPDMLQGDMTVLAVPEFENRAYRIRGRPDGIRVDRGALFPIEVKSHKAVQRLDELELAFYWLVLEPQRTRNRVRPRGYLILRRDGRAETVEVPISPQRLDEVRRLIVEVRQARRHGVRPRVCGCTVCSRVKRDEVFKAVSDRADLTMIFGVGRVYARELEEIGLGTWKKLLRCRPATVAELLRSRGYPTVTVTEVERWKRHARSYATTTPVFFGRRGAFPVPDDSFIAVDLEYGGLIWLMGVCAVAGADREYLMLWADDSAEEKKNLRRLLDFVGERPGLPVVTWGGNGADIPQLRGAARRQRVRDLDALLDRHVDLYDYARKNVRLPIASLGLKDVSGYFGVRRKSGILDGLQAQSLYLRYLRSGDPRVRRRLVKYNRDDLDGLTGACLAFRGLAKPRNATERLPTLDRVSPQKRTVDRS